MKKILALVLSLVMLLSCTAALADGAAAADASEKAASMSYDELLAAALGEGQVFSVGMPDEWANWKDLWSYVEGLGLKHSDTDMSSAEELARFELQGKADADIGDIGISMTGVAMEKDLLLAYKPSTWDSIPDYAKDPDGKWVEAYTCTTAFMTDLDNVEKAPTTWDELLEGDYKVWIGDIEKAAQAYVGVLACAYAHGGDETNLEPAMEFFATLAKQGRLITSNPYVENIEKGEVGVAIVWDFNALGYAETIYESQGENNGRFAITIPSDGAAASGYANVISKYANNPYAAMLVREIMLSDVGQEFLALGHAKPIRTDVNLSEEAKASILDNSMYSNVYQVKDWAVFDATVAELPELWAENVAIYMN
jgi:putative spermidine/putrescine transport system substrate-binding protein